MTIKPALLQTNTEITGEFEELDIKFYVMRHPFTVFWVFKARAWARDCRSGFDARLSF